MNFLLQLLNVTVFATETWQLQQLNAIVEAAQVKSEILTITLFGELRDVGDYIRVLEHRTTPKLVVTQNYGEIKFHHESGLNKEIFFIAVGYLERKALWYHMNNAFGGIQGHVRGVFITKHPARKNSRLNIRQHFQWCWQRGFTNVLILVDNESPYQNRFEVYNYNHFAPTKITNMTLFRAQELYPDKFRNLHKFKIRTAAQFDPPRVFESSHNATNYKDRLLGYVVLLFKAFLREYNADLDLLYLGRNKSHNILNIMQKIENDEIDLGLNPYTPHKSAYLSYPLRMLQRCVVVPFPNELSKYKFFILPFESGVWISYLAAWLILSIAKLLGLLLKHRKWPKDMCQIYLEVWRLMMYLPSSNSGSYKDLKWFNALWFSLISLMAFIFSNLYMASLTSFFSGLTFQPAINTLAELIERRVIVDAADYEIPTIIDNRDLPKDFSGLLRARNSYDLLNEIIALKSHRSYVCLEDRIQFAFSQQTHLLQPISHKVKECLTTMPLGFLMPPHSQFEKPLNRFILRSSAAGLIDKWILDAIQDGYCSGVLKMRAPRLQVSRPLTLKHFQFGWFVLAAGYMLGSVTLLLENSKRLLKRFRIFIVYY